MDQQSPSSVRPCPTAAAAANNKKSRWLFGREKKGWGPRAEFCLENGALGGLVLVVDMSTAKTESQKQIQRRWENHVRSKLPLLLVAMEMMECPPMFQNSLCRKISFTISPFRGDFFWESEKGKGMRNPTRPFAPLPFTPPPPPPRFNSSDIGPDSF